MIDTVVASMELPWVGNAPDFVYEGERTVKDERGTVSKRWATIDGVSMEYYVNFRSLDRLRVEFSVPRIAVWDRAPDSNMSYRDVLWSVGRASEICGYDVMGMTCQRVDYAHNFEVGAKLLPAYLAVCRGLQLSNMHKQPYPPQDGVVWKSANRHGKWVKFYNAGRLRGHVQSVLRFEVSNMRRSVQRMARNWFDCERTVAELIKPGRVAYALGHAWQRLGMDVPEYASELGIMGVMHDHFGRSAGTAFYAWTAIRKYGEDARGTVLSDDQYYTWRKKLRDKGLLSLIERGTALTGLTLPYDTLLSDFEARKPAQNLDKISRIPLTPIKKIPGENPDLPPDLPANAGKTAVLSGRWPVPESVYRDLGLKPGIVLPVALWAWLRDRVR